MSQPSGGLLLGCFGGLGLLLHGFFHAEGVHHQLRVGQDFGLVAADVALDGLVGRQLGEVAIGHNQVEQVRAVVGFGFLVFSCTRLISFSSFSICAMVAVYWSRSAGLTSVLARAAWPWAGPRHAPQ